MKSEAIVLIVLLIAEGILSESSTIVGDVVIYTKNGTIYCDSMVCPAGSASCSVTKRTDQNNLSKIIRSRTCFDLNGAVTAEESVIERNPRLGIVNINVSSGLNGGRELTPEERKELEHLGERINDQVQNSLEFLGPLQEELSHLGERITSQVQNDLRNAFGNY